MKGNLWISLITLLAFLGVLAMGQDSAISGSENQEGKPEEMRRVTVDPSKLSGMQTLVGFFHRNPPPWPEGNCLTLTSKTNAQSGLPSGDWRLVNMHAENFHELVKRRHLKSLELGLLGNQRCLVVDSRVPGEWLLTRPCGRCCSLEQRLSLKTQFAGFFRKNPQADSLVGTTWVLVRRKDPDGLIERVLPGEKIHFGVVELTCHAASGVVRGLRSWELDGPKAPFLLCVYDVQSSKVYTGAALGFTRSKDQMVLVPKDILKRSDDTVGSERYDAPAEATYRIAK